MPSKVQPNRRGKTVGPNIVRAWFDTVINPLLYGLDTERALLAAENWTWRCRPPRLLSLVPIREHLVREAWDNLEQFLAFQPQCQPPIQRHDQHAEGLLRQCQALHKALTNHPAMHILYRQAVAELSLASSSELASVFGTDSPEEHLDVLAEYIVNSVEELPPSFYNTAPLWNRHRDEFLQLREARELRPRWEAVRAQGGKLARAAEEVDEALRQARDGLSLTHDVPFVCHISPRAPRELTPHL
jgi:hypothetical protein